MQWWRDWKPHKWVDVQFALEQFSGAEGNKDGILFIYYTFNDEKKVILHTGEDTYGIKIHVYSF